MVKKPISIKILNFIFKIISSLLPVKKRVLVLGSPRNPILMENTQLVYDNISHDKKVIIKQMPHSLFDILYVSFFIMTSKVIILDDHYRYFAYIPLKNNQKLIQLWHGAGIYKKAALDLPNPNTREYFTHSQYDSFIITSPNISKYFESGFNLTPDKIKALGSPRTDLLINNKEKLENDFYTDFPYFRNKKIIVYLPTYRRYDNELLNYDYEIDWKKFDKYLIDNDGVCLVKRHPLQINANLNIVPGYCKNIVDMGNYSYFPMICGSDILITDYSSVFFDYLLLDKPIIFYCPDANEYVEKNGIYLKFPDDLPGIYCETFDDVLENLDNGKNFDYSVFKQRYMGSCDGKSTLRVIKLIESYMDDSDL